MQDVYGQWWQVLSWFVDPGSSGVWQCLVASLYPYAPKYVTFMGPEMSDVSLWEALPDDPLKLGPGVQEIIGVDMHKGSAEVRFFNDPGIYDASAVF